MKVFGKYFSQNKSVEYSSIDLSQFSKFSNFYLRLFRLLLAIRCIGSLVLWGFFKANPLILIYFVIYIFFLVLTLQKNTKYTSKYLYLSIFIDFLLIFFLYYIKYNNIFIISLAIISASLFGNIWLIFITTIIASFSVLSNNLNSIESIISILVLILISSVLHALSRHQQSIYRTVAQQAYQSSLQQVTHMLMVKDITDGILLISERNTIISANTAALNILGLDDINSKNFTINNIYKEAKERIPKTVWLSEKQAHAHLVPINQHMQSMHFQLGWLDWIKPYVYIDAIETYIQKFLQNSTLIHIEREQKYLKEAQKDKLATMGHMVAGIAHEIRNPLATIRSAYELLFEQLELDDTQKRLKNMVDNNITRINDIIENILNISKPPSDSVSINLSKALLSIIQEWQDRDNSRKLISTYYIPQNNLHTNFTPVHLQQVIENLLDNALKFCSKEVSSISIWLRHHPQYTNLLEIWILNDGNSIDNADRARLFEPFFTKSAPTHSTKGIGLGLHIVRMLCTQNKATIEYAKNIDIPFKANHGFVIRLKKET